MSDQNTAESDVRRECDECGNAFHTDQNDSPPFICSNCKSDNASPLNG
jgi:Zn finger protein HypA/HybF involved in hydrogenase expression